MKNVLAIDFGASSGRAVIGSFDGTTAGTSDYSKRFIDHNRLYEKTGIQIMEINTAFQLLSIIRDRSELLDRADKMLMMPDLFAYYLGAKPVAEMSIASTTQLFDANTKTWSEECCERLKIKHSLLPEIAAGGTVVGTLSDEICKELDIKPAKIIAACGHDTQSAMVAVPASEKDFVRNVVASRHRA